MKKYIWCIDASLAQTGYAIFDDNETLVCYGSIPTSSKLNTPIRLKMIADKLLDLNSKYPSFIIVKEQGYVSKFLKSTEQVFRVHGLIEYLFSDKEIIDYSPRTVKKLITGSGKSDKSTVAKVIEDKFNMTFSDYDQTDAIALGLVYFMMKG